MVVAVLMLFAACRSEQPYPSPPLRTAEVRITVDDTSATVGAVTAAVEASGGYLSDSKIWRDGETMRAHLTLHVPPEKLTSTLASIRAAAKRVEEERVHEKE